MKIAFATTFSAQDVHRWSGTPFHMAHALQTQGMDVEYIGPLKRKLPRFFKLNQAYKQLLLSQRESPRYNIVAAQNYSKEVARRMERSQAKAIISPLVNPIAYLDCKQPVVLWTDALYAATLGFYPLSQFHTSNTISNANTITRECLSRCQLAIFSSDWAANSAVELYGTSREKVKVVPFGANIDSYPNLDEIKTIINNRATTPFKILFLAKNWERKGGDIVIDVVNALHAAEIPVELNIIGYHPSYLNHAPDHIKCHGFISKQTSVGRAKFNAILADSHMLFVPSRAEAYGIAFCEANAFGVPCMTTYVGGISTVIKNNINGMTFGLDAHVSVFCEYIVELINDRKLYEELALSSYHEFITRLNWHTAAKQVQKLISEL